MANTYNFTVRAEDEQGAFADRDFSIVVRNTSIDRYMVVDNTDAYTSPDMVSWTKRIGHGGNNVAYGGGKWLIQYGTTSANTYRLSTDGINFTTHVVQYKYSENSSLANSGSLSHYPVWIGNCWVVCVGLSSPSGNAVLKSTDGVNWETLATVTGASNALVGLPSYHDGYLYYSNGSLSAKRGYHRFELNGDLYQNQSTSDGYTLMNFPNALTSPTFCAPPTKVNDLWISLHQNGSAVNIYYSSDLNVWNMGTMTWESSAITSGRRYQKIQYVNGVIMITDYKTGSEYMAHVLLSDDGMNFVSKRLNANTPYTSGTDTSVVMAKGKTYFVTKGTFASSTDLGATGMTGANVTAVAAEFPVNSINGFASVR